jgi:cytochrome c biogenesis protein CcdA
MLEDKAQTLMTGIGALLPLIVSQALNVIGAIVILLVGLWLAGKVRDRFGSARDRFFLALPTHLFATNS